MTKTDFNSAEINIVYIFKLPDVTTHRGHLKIGKASIKVNEYIKADDKDGAIKKAANDRINRQGSEQDIIHELIHYEICIKNDKVGSSFTDKDVHKVLERSGYKNITHREDKKYGEWYGVELDVAINAINAVKDGRSSLDPNEKISTHNPIQFRKGSQDEAIKKTIKAIDVGKEKFLWDAKMRFGKTLASLQIAKEKGYKKVLIITHRPVVNKDWYDDFEKIFYDTNYKFGSKSAGDSLEYLLSQGNPFVYFASTQNLGGSRCVLEKLNTKVVGFEKNDKLFETEWDYLIIDEAHEGTKTELATAIISSVKRKFLLALSGTPFNLMDGDSVNLDDLSLSFKADEIYTWDYVMEQELKENWSTLYPDEPNPYLKLPKLSIYTYNLNKYIPQSDFVDVYDKAFNFKEFFRTNEEGKFIHEKHIRKFLDIIATESNSNFPFSTVEFRNNLRHTLWMLPGVKEAYALEKLLIQHPVFSHFNVANVAGEGNEEESEKDARKKVEKAISKDPSSAYSITLTCGRMTTGVSIPQWTAVIMLSNTSSSTTYLQTAFRAQTPYESEGCMKTECFVFDFAPDRTLKIVSDAMRVKKRESSTPEQKKEIGKFLNFCPIISASAGEMKVYSTNELLHAIKKAIIEKVTKNGFDDARLYNNSLLNLSDVELKDFQNLQIIIGQSKQTKSTNEVVINKQGFSEEEYEKAKELEKKAKKELTEEEKERLKKLREVQTQRRSMISILRGISIRMPMLIFGCNVDNNEDISIEKFIDLVDDESWKEFMPEGVTKAEFRKFTKYYDEEVFIAAGHDIRLRALAADRLMPLERILEISEIFSGFKNPDKETVLTPWKVVNMHLSDSIGGNNFNQMIKIEETSKNGVKEIIELPEWVKNSEFENLWGNKDAKILEINSKSGLYPLIAAYNLYTKALLKVKNVDGENYRELWHKILSDNIYIICKTPMAEYITRRTLVGYDGIKVNTIYIEDINNKLRDEKFDLKRVLNDNFNKGENMKFDIVIGNPPYQGVNGQQIYVDFYMQSLRLADYSCLIFPRSWRLPKNGNGLKRINNAQYKHDSQIVKITDYNDAFPGVPGASEVNVVLWKRHYNNGLNGKVPIQYADGSTCDVLLPLEAGLTQKPDSIQGLAQSVQKQSTDFLENYVSSNKPYGLRTDVFKNPQKYGVELQESGKIKIIGIRNQVKFISKDQLIKKGLHDKWKVFIPGAWGNWSRNYLGGAYSDIIVAGPGVICTETYNECGPFKDGETAVKAAKYLLTQFTRALIYAKKNSQHTTRTEFEFVPVQSFNEPWWNGDISDIQESLFAKYNVSKDNQLYITTNIQQKSASNFTIVTHDK